MSLRPFPKDFPVSSFAPGVWVEWEGRKLIAVRDKGKSESCVGCVFLLEGELAIPSRCSIEIHPDASRICASTQAGRAFSETVRIMDEPTYIKMRIKGEL